MTGKTIGGCLCGAIRYEFDGPPDWSRIATARPAASTSPRRSPPSSASAAAVSASPATCRKHVSSPGVRRSFCAECGSPIAYEADRVPDEIHLYHGTLDDPGAVEAEAHVHAGEQLPWFEVHDSLPRYEAGGRGGKRPIRRGPRRAPNPYLCQARSNGAG
jgi:hypothetical protein